MKKQFLLNILLIVFLNALIKPFWVFGIDRNIQNTIGSASYGLYFALMNFAILFNTFLDFGITNFNNRNIAQNPAEIHYHFPSLLFFKFFLGFVYVFFCVGLALTLGYSSVAVKLLAVLAFNQFLASAFLFLRSNVSALQLYTIDSFLSIADRFLMIIFCSFLLWTNWITDHVDIFDFVYAQTVAYSIICLAAIFIILKHVGRFEFLGHFIISRKVLKQSLPYALLAILMASYTRIDAIFIERLLPEGDKNAGIYAQGFRIFDAVTMISVVFSSLLLPMFAKLLSDKKDVKPILGLSFTFLFTGSLILVIQLIIFAQPLLKIMYTEFFPESVSVFSLLMVNILPVSITYIFGTLLTADGKLKLLNLIAIITLILNISLNLILIPHYGVIGAAFSALISQIAVGIFQYRAMQKYYSIKVSFTNMVPYFILMLASIVVGWIVYTLHLGVLESLSISLSISFIISIFLKIINLKEILLVFRAESQI